MNFCQATVGSVPPVNSLVISVVVVAEPDGRDIVAGEPTEPRVAQYDEVVPVLPTEGTPSISARRPVPASTTPRIMRFM